MKTSLDRVYYIIIGWENARIAVRRTGRGWGEEYVFRKSEDGRDYIFNIVVDTSDNTYTISVLEPRGKFAFIAIANTIVVTREGEYIKEERGGYRT